jgi:type III restriction enzyme
MDEPHKFEGGAFQTFFQGFNNYYLRFGATFPKGGNKLSNVAYTLDSISSFRQNLVKKIVVYTQDIVKNKDSLECINKVGSAYKATVKILSNGITTEQVLGIGSKYNEHSITKVNKDSIVLDNNEIVKVGYSLSDEALRQMIRVAIQVHFEKEKILFERGIKALSLFFIESNIELFRGIKKQDGTYDLKNAKIHTIFEEEYKLQRDEIFNSLPDCDYKKYLQNDFDTDGNLCVHKGYFSGDKGSADEKIKAGTDEILKDKKKLLSFESPTRFIFSIWALQEGWDNPNVFTICKLSNQGSEVSKLQQIGRGLRICVAQDLKRRTIKAFADNQEEFWKVNNLDVVVSDQEGGFVEAIQNEILSNSFFVNDVFSGQDLKKALKEKNNFDDNTVRKLFRLLEDKKMIVFKETINGNDVFEKSSNYSQLLTAEKPNLPPEQFSALENLFASDMKNFVQEKSKIKPKKIAEIKENHIAEFKKLWNAINQNAFYVIDNLDKTSLNLLIDNIKAEIEAIQIDEILLRTIRAELHSNKIGEEDAITTATLSSSVSYKSKVDYLKFVEDLANNTHTPIAFIAKIFNALDSSFKQKILANNPAQAFKEMSEIIKKQLVGIIKTKVDYTIDGTISNNPLICEPQATYFNAGECGKYQQDITADFSLKEKWIFKDVIEYDSDFEVDIIKTDPNDDQIQIFGKLPKLKIKTPLGEYNPDFCYAITANDNRQLILIVESKGYKTSADIPQNEKEKIDFARKYFKTLNDYYKKKNQNVKITFKDRINTTQLTSLIKEALNS